MIFERTEKDRLWKSADLIQATVVVKQPDDRSGTESRHSLARRMDLRWFMGTQEVGHIISVHTMSQMPQTKYSRRLQTSVIAKQLPPRAAVDWRPVVRARRPETSETGRKGDGRTEGRRLGLNFSVDDAKGTRVR